MSGVQFGKFFSVLSLGAALAAGACAPVFNGPEQTLSVAERHPIAVDPATVTLLLPVPMGRVVLPEEDRARLALFAANWRTLGHGPISLSVPTGSPNAQAAYSLSADAREILELEDIPPGAINASSYTAAREEKDAPIVLSFVRYVATPSACGDWSQNAGRSSRNTPMPNFGCATQNNLAVMVADPHDLVTPQRETPASAGRRSTVLGAYQQGKSTATTYPDDSAATVSAVGE